MVMVDEAGQHHTTHTQKYYSKYRNQHDHHPHPHRLIHHSLLLFIALELMCLNQSKFKSILNSCYPFSVNFNSSRLFYPDVLNES